MRVLVVTVVHTPLDARIYHREIAALREAGHEVVYVAPWSGYGIAPPTDVPGLEPRDVVRASGRDRLRALRDARRLVRSLAPTCDLVLLHDPELLLATAFLGRRTAIRARDVDMPTSRSRIPLVWDVHEDTAGALVDKPWLPGFLRPVVRAAVAALERLAERRRHLLLAEEAYADRFRRPHPVVPNTPRVPPEVPPPGGDRVVYLGRVSRLRGAAELVGIARALAGEGVTVEVIGQADADVEPALRAAGEHGLDWRGFVPNDEALPRLEGALAGLSLLADEPNYRVSLPTKVLEYAGRGIPVITTPLPPAVRIVEAYDCGVVVPFGDPDAAALAIRELRDDAARRRRLGRNGHEAVVERHNWDVDGPAFVRQLEGWATRVPRATSGTP
ncbi:MAG: glycosyltransferase [Actinobacteria bacterium]|nr:glycosyltransferase [Actinomycetota bacterium]